MHIDTNPKLDFDSVLIRPKRSTLQSRSGVDIIREYKYKWSPFSYQGTPIIAANMDTVGTVEMYTALNEFGVSTALHKHYSVEQLVELFDSCQQSNMWYSMGILSGDIEKYNNVTKAIQAKWAANAGPVRPGPEFLQQPIKNVCIDVANGYSQYFVEFVKKFREDNPLAVIMAGNVVTPEITEELILAGADIVKVGIGPGSVCTTRKKTGVGYPQLSCIIECADAAHGLEGLICADGGCKTPGDVAKAFGGGADFVMLGGMLAGHDEGGGEIVGGTYKIQPNSVTTITRSVDAYCDTFRVEVGKKQYAVIQEDIDKLMSNRDDLLPELHKKYPGLVTREGELQVEFYGMSSKTAQDKHNGGVAEYRASEGKRVLIPYRGPVNETIKEILGGLRSACTYVGARRLKELSKRTTFILVHDTHNRVFGD